MNTPESIAQKYENREVQEQINKIEKLNKLERQKQVYVMDLQGYENRAITVKEELYNLIKQRAKKDLRGISNYLEHELITRHVE